MFRFKQDLVKTGKMIYELGLVDSHSGNISILSENRMSVTRTGVKLGYLIHDDIIEFNIHGNIPQSASSEAGVHRSIYLNTRHRAVIHTHSFYSVLLSFYYDTIIPVDSEGLFFNPETPVLDCGEVTVGSACVMENLPEKLNNSLVCIVRGHGVFSAGKDLDQAMKHLSSLENSCKLIYHKSMYDISRRQ